MNNEEMRKVITNKIIKYIEDNKDDLKFIKGWKSALGSLNNNYCSGKSYNGINQLLLAISFLDNGFKSNKWLTFNQAKSKNIKINKGEKSTDIIFFKYNEFCIECKNDKKSCKCVISNNNDFKNRFKKIPIIKSYKVFNICQTNCKDYKIVDDFDFNKKKKDAILKHELFLFTNEYLTVENIDLNFSGNRAFYSVNNDSITMPQPSSFIDKFHFYSTLFHELSHSTGHEKRLNRDLKNKFGSVLYAKEEIIADLSSMFLCAKFNLDFNKSLENHSAYINSWLECLKNDSSFIFKASSKSLKSYEFILNSGGINK